MRSTNNYKCPYRYSKNKLIAEKYWTEGGDKGENYCRIGPEPTNYQKLSDKHYMKWIKPQYIDGEPKIPDQWPLSTRLPNLKAKRIIKKAW